MSQRRFPQAIRPSAPLRSCLALLRCAPAWAGGATALWGRRWYKRGLGWRICCMRMSDGFWGQFLIAFVSGVVAVPALAQDLVAPTEARSPAEERRAFKLPPGFEAQLVAAEPEIQKPMHIAFDAKGRLWVTDTIEYPYPAAAGKTPRDSVKVLEDFGADGRARKVTTFAQGLNIPIGILPLPDARSALVYSIDKIQRFSDGDGDGKAERRD